LDLRLYAPDKGAEIEQEIREIIIGFLVYHLCSIIMLFKSKSLEKVNSLRIILFTCLFFGNLVNTIMAFSTVSKFNAAVPEGEFFSSLSLRRTMIYLEICTFLSSLIALMVYLAFATVTSQKFDWASVDPEREQALLASINGQ
jgi:hypothetical protein